MPQSEQRPKVTVEDLLRLKRAERPAAEFWSNFDRELRQKQLAALLKKRSWWQEMPHWLARHAYVPVGATAIFAFTLVSVKYFPSSPAVPGGAEAVSLGAASLAVVPVEVSATAADSSILVNRSETLASAGPVSVAGDETIAAAGDTDVMPVMVAPSPAQTPSARSIAANLARLEQSEPELVNSVLGSRLSPPARELTAATPAVAELANLSSGAGKRNRLLVSYSDRLLSPEPTAPTVVRERLARRLGDPEITDRLSRIGIKGDEVSLGLTLRL